MNKPTQEQFARLDDLIQRLERLEPRTREDGSRRESELAILDAKTLRMHGSWNVTAFNHLYLGMRSLDSAVAVDSAMAEMCIKNALVQLCAVRENFRRSSLAQEQSHTVSKSFESPESVELSTPIQDATEPPRVAERLLLFVVPRHAREYVAGDLREEFLDVSHRHGQRFAACWYWRQVAGSIIQYLWRLLRRVALWVAAWSLRHVLGSDT